MAIHRGLGSIMPKITSHRAGIIITIIAAIMLITPLSSAERKVIVDMQEISDYDVNETAAAHPAASRRGIQGAAA